MNTTIRLTRFAADTTNVVTTQQQGWPVRILAEGVNMPSEVFVYHVGQEGDPISGDKFECVASVLQMYDLPRNGGVALTAERQIPYYRTNTLDFIAPTAEEAERIWAIVQEDVQSLVKNWNAAAALRVTETAVITDEQITIHTMQLTPPKRVQLSYHPCGTLNTDLSGKQFIVSEDPEQVGWMPVSHLGPGAEGVPNGARFYYNIVKDGGLQAVWPPLTPYNGHQLFRNGILMPYGIVWKLTNQTIWWLDFDEETVATYVRLGDSQDVSTPWPSDYVSRGTPGDVPTNLTLMLFQ